LEKNNGKPPLTYHQFQNVVASMDPPPLPELAVSLETLRSCWTPVTDEHDEKYGVPSLEELGQLQKFNQWDFLLLNFALQGSTRTVCYPPCGEAASRKLWLDWSATSSAKPGWPPLDDLK
jgi:hypothetical protein